MRLFAFFVSLLIGVNYAQAETYKCSAIWGLESWENEEPFIRPSDQIPDVLLKNQGKVAMVVIGNREPELYLLTESTPTTLVYQLLEKPMDYLHTIYVWTFPKKPKLYYDFIDLAGSRYSYNYECSVN